MNNESKNFVIIASIAFIILLVMAFSKPDNTGADTATNATPPQVNQTKPVKKVAPKTKPKPKELTKASQSPLNQNMKELALQGALTSDGLTKADMAYWATGTYGYDCYEIKSVKFVDGSKMYLEDGDLDIESRIINPKRFAYQEATCTSGLKLRFYKQKDYYPYIITEKELRGIYDR